MYSPTKKAISLEMALVTTLKLAVKSLASLNNSTCFGVFEQSQGQLNLSQTMPKSQALE